MRGELLDFGRAVVRVRSCSAGGHLLMRTVAREVSAAAGRLSTERDRGVRLRAYRSTGPPRAANNAAAKAVGPLPTTVRRALMGRAGQPARTGCRSVSRAEATHSGRRAPRMRP